MSDPNDTEIDPSLVKKLLFTDNPKIRITNEALEAAGFLLKRFISEMRYRASIEAELDTDNDGSIDGKKYAAGDDEDDDDSRDGTKSRKKRKLSSNSTRNDNDDDDDDDDPIVIRAKHVLKISAEMLMDFA